MIDELNETVKNIEAVIISVPYLSVTIVNSGADMHIDREDFDKLIDDVDQILITTRHLQYCMDYKIEKSILIGTVRVFALYRE